MKNDTLSVNRAELRRFGVVMAVAFALISCLRWWIKGHLPETLFVVAGVFLVLGVILPIALKPVYRAWMAFALALNWVMTRLLLTVAFYGMIAPVGIAYRLIAGDPLKRRWEPSAETYWEAPDDQPSEIDAYRNQF